MVVFLHTRPQVQQDSPALLEAARMRYYGLLLLRVVRLSIPSRAARASGGQGRGYLQRERTEPHLVRCTCRQMYQERAALAKCDMGRRCLKVMARKRTNLAVAVDVPTAAEMLRIADQARAAADAYPGARTQDARSVLRNALQALDSKPHNACGTMCCGVQAPRQHV